MTQESLLTISEASQVLGVSEAALRQWTDEGQIKAFITPGGHRRYSRSELKRLLNTRQKPLGLKDLISELEATARQHREIAQASLKTTEWYSQLGKESQEHLAELGRRLLQLIIRYITEPSKQEGVIDMAREIGHDHGETLASLGLPLTDAVEVFLMHRDPIMNATTDLMKKRQAISGRIVGSISRVAHIMDEALVALVAAHQQQRSNSSNNQPQGGNSK